MKLYLTIIAAAMIIISVFNLIFIELPWYYIIISVIWCTALQFASDGLFAFLINKLPDKWFGVGNPLYKVTKKERELYKKLGVRRWKDKVWELGGIGGFSKKELKKPDNPKYIEKFIVECNKGVLTHRIAYPIGFFAMITLSMPLSVTIALPVAIVNLFLNVLPTIVLRYNTPMLISVLSRMKRHADKN